MATRTDGIIKKNTEDRRNGSKIVEKACDHILWLQKVKNNKTARISRGGVRFKI